MFQVFFFKLTLMIYWYFFGFIVLSFEYLTLLWHFGYLLTPQHSNGYFYIILLYFSLTLHHYMHYTPGTLLEIHGVKKTPIWY